jgi:chemotaxis protein MotB
MSSDHPEIVIVRRRGPREEEHHGGAWKIAFADFMTAMMAFFLVLWIISATDKNTKTIIARYFNPVKVEEPARAQKGIRAPDPNIQGPGKDSSGAGEKARPDQGETAGKPSAEAIEATPKDAKSSQQARAAQADPAHPMPTMAEEELFSDPMASLDRISGGPPPRPRADPASAPPEGVGDLDHAGDSYRDPFRPLGGDNTISEATDSGRRADAPREEPRATPSEPPRDAASQSLENRDPEPQQRPANQEAAIPGSSVPEPKLSPKLGPTPSQSQALRPQDAKAPPDAARARAAALLAQLKKRLGLETPTTSGPQLDVQATDEGILISLTDRENYSMFAIGSAEPQSRVVHMMDAVATSLQGLPGAIVVRGHTDARQYRSAHYDNWRLSSARAQMAYYMLNRAGIADKRFERIEGFADHHLKDLAKPFAAENRRIEILLREAKP